MVIVAFWCGEGCGIDLRDESKGWMEVQNSKHEHLTYKRSSFLDSAFSAVIVTSREEKEIEAVKNHGYEMILLVSLDG